jgi:hypothetical protein
MGLTLSHFKQRSSVLPVRSVIASNGLLHLGQRTTSMQASLFVCFRNEPGIIDLVAFN